MAGSDSSNQPDVEDAAEHPGPDKEEEAVEAATQDEQKHRPDIDILRIAMTWCILLFHVVLIYVPIPYYLSHPGSDHQPGWPLGFAFVLFMNTWNMPLFFFISGISSFLSLFKRTETQYRDERVHRLLVPTLSLIVFTEVVFSVVYVAPLTPNCQRYYDGNLKVTDDADECQLFYKFTRNETALGFVLRFVSDPNVFFPSPHQAWFCIYLFVYSQLTTFQFLAWHPAHNKEDEAGPTCCGSGCIKRPFSRAVKLCCCLHCCCCCLPASSPAQLTTTANKLLGHPLKLLVVPGLFVGAAEAFLRLGFADGQFWMFSFLFDWANNVNFLSLYILGYVVAAADETGLKESVHKSRWWGLIVGFLSIMGYVVIAFMNMFKVTSDICGYNDFCGIGIVSLQGFLRGMGEWMFVIGLYGVARSLLTTNYSWIPTLRLMAMPFYLLHQQVLILLASGTMWVPYLRSFPVTLVLASVLAGLLAYLVTKAGPLRYLWGLPPPKGSTLLPGKRLRGFVPLLVLVVLLLAESFAGLALRKTVLV